MIEGESDKMETVDGEIETDTKGKSIIYYLLSLSLSVCL